MFDRSRFAKILKIRLDVSFAALTSFMSPFASPFMASFAASSMTCCTAFLFVTSPGTAKAVGPATSTSAAIKKLQLSIPVALDEKNGTEMVGLKLEDEDLQKSTRKETADYLRYREARRASKVFKSWVAACEKSKSNPTPRATVYCEYEGRRLEKPRLSRSTSLSYAERLQIAKALQEGRFTDLSSYDYPSIVHGLATVSERARVLAIGDKAAQTEICIAPHIATALGFKIEEYFPDTETIGLAEKLYRKAVSCGTGAEISTASFRLGLILIWKKNCADVDKLMRHVESDAAASLLHARAKYWRHYCAMIAGDKVVQKAAKLSLLNSHPMSFHNLALNGDDVGSIFQHAASATRGPSADTASAAKKPVAFAVRSLIRTDLNAMIRSVEALIDADASHLASEMLEMHVPDLQNLEPEVRLYTAILMDRIEAALPKFKILSSLFQSVPRMIAPETMRLYFPLRYLEQVKQRSVDVDPMLILSLMRQESAFNKRARSVAGARGLMQVMPRTARSIASVSVGELYDPATNIRIGAKYFRKRLDEFKGDVEMTLAAYNAGASRVKEWQKRYPTDNKLLFLDFIPFKETRDYVSSILRNYYWYVRLYGTEPAPVEGVRIDPNGMKILAIMNANAGLAAGLQDRTNLPRLEP